MFANATVYFFLGRIKGIDLYLATALKVDISTYLVKLLHLFTICFLL